MIVPFSFATHRFHFVWMQISVRTMSRIPQKSGIPGPSSIPKFKAPGLPATSTTAGHKRRRSSDENATTSKVGKTNHAAELRRATVIASKPGGKKPGVVPAPVRPRTATQRKPVSTNMPGRKPLTGTNRPLPSQRAATTAKNSTDKTSDIQDQMKKLQQTYKQLAEKVENIENQGQRSASNTPPGSESSLHLPSDFNFLAAAEQRSAARCQQLEVDLAMTEGRLTALTRTAEEAREAADRRDAELRAVKVSLEGEVAAHKTRCDNLQRDLIEAGEHNRELEAKVASLQSEVRSANTVGQELRQQLASMTAGQTTLEIKLKQQQTVNSDLHEENVAKQMTIETKEKEILTLSAEIETLNSKLREGEMMRRRLHNEVQELKGNIRVFCRVRPILPTEKSTSAHITCRVEGDNSHIDIDPGKIMPAETSGRRATVVPKAGFTFDKVFSQSDNQDTVFKDISQLVQSALDGYNVCIFAYGQTGSGKTFTMEGDPRDSALHGMIPRSLRQVFQWGQDLREHGWNYTMKASFLEIYNEVIRDLLRTGGEVKHEVKLRGKDSKEVYVTNLTSVDVTSEDQVQQLLEMSSGQRSVAATQANLRSSRSHCVFSLDISGNNTVTGQTCKGSLNLIDLAGSERVKETGSTGERFDEACSINTSLSALGRVIMALGKKGSHVPFRASKLTQVLQNSLSGNSKVLMFVNISPLDHCCSESLNSLRFAKKVNDCHIGTAHKQT